VLKRKRNIGNKINKRYENFLKKLVSENKLFIVEFQYDIYKLIQHSVATIHMPYTSTAIHARYLNISNNVYYEPTGEIYTHPLLNNGIKLISSKKKLSNWFKNL